MTYIKLKTTQKTTCSQVPVMMDNHTFQPPDKCTVI